MLRLYVSDSGLHSCLGSEDWRELLEFLTKAGVRSSKKKFKQAAGYWWAELKGDGHLAAVQLADLRGGIPRLTYRGLFLLVSDLLARRLKTPLSRRAQ